MSKMRNFIAWLPILQLAIAVGLSLVGRAQTHRQVSGGSQVWDYNAPAEILLHSINYPAAVATGLTSGHRSFQIGPEYSVGRWLLYLSYIAVLWYAIAYCLDNYFSTVSNTPAWLAGTGVLVGTLLSLAAVSMLQGPYAWALIGSAFLWSALLLVSSCGSLVRRVRTRE
jgi:hypothetical protein